MQPLANRSSFAANNFQPLIACGNRSLGFRLTTAGLCWRQKNIISDLDEFIYLSVEIKLDYEIKTRDSIHKFR